MKKFLSLLTLVVILFTVSAMPAFAAEGYSAVYTVVGDTGEVGALIDVTLTLKGASEIFSWQGVLQYTDGALAPYDWEYNAEIESKVDAQYCLVEHVLDSATSGSRPKAYYKQIEYTFASNAFGVSASVAGSDAGGIVVPVSSEGYAVYTARFVRKTTDPLNLKIHNIMATKIETSDSSGNVLDAANVTIDYTAPGGNGGEVGGNDSFEATPEDVATVTDWKSGFKYDTDKTAVENTVSGYEGKKVVTFGKNASGSVLAKGAYGVQIKNRTYAGGMDVPANAYFAIIIINSNSDAAILDSYTYKVWTGSEDAPEFQTGELNAVVAK